MTEREPQPEEPDKYLYDDCLNCDERYVMSEYNAFLNIYINDPQCSHIQTQCPHCNQVSRIFIQVEGDTVEKCADYGIEPKPFENAPEELKLAYAELIGEVYIPPAESVGVPEEPYVTPHQEKVIKALAYYLQHDHLTADDFNGEGDLFI